MNDLVTYSVEVQNIDTHELRIVQVNSTSPEAAQREALIAQFRRPDGWRSARALGAYPSERVR